MSQTYCVSLVMEEIAQVRCDTEAEMILARNESQQEIATLFHSLIASGIRITWRRRGTLSGEVAESFVLDGVTPEFIAPLLEDLRYYRLKIQPSDSQEDTETARAGHGVYRRVNLVHVGGGVTQKRLHRTFGHPAPILPLTLPQQAEAKELAFRAPLAQALHFPADATDRGRPVRRVLQGNPDAWIDIQIGCLDLSSLSRAYLQRILAYYSALPHPSERTEETHLATESYREILAANACAFGAITVSNQVVLNAFLQETDPQGFSLKSTPFTEAKEADMLNRAQGKPLLNLISGMGSTFSLTEAMQMLTPSITFRDALPGTKHFSPVLLPEFTLPVIKPGGTLLIGYTQRKLPARLPLASLSVGTLVSGAAGSGKSFLVQRLLHEAHKAQKTMPVQVYDPIGYEYRALMEKVGGKVVDFDLQKPFLKYNPFFAPPHRTLHDYALWIGGIIGIAFPSNEVARNYIKNMVEALYSDKIRRTTGKEPDLVAITGEWLLRNKAATPTFAEFLEFAPKWLAKQGTSSHFQEAAEYFRARLGTLKNSLLERVWSGTAPIYSLFEESFLIEFRRVGDQSERATLMGALYGANYIYRLDNKRGDLQGSAAENRDQNSLVALICVEEAHNFLPGKASGYGGEELGKSPEQVIAEMLQTALREGRKEGLGQIFVSQSVSCLNEAVLVNCTNQFAFRTQLEDDQRAVGKALGLPETNHRCFSSLQRGECVARLQGWQAPALLTIPAS